MSGTNTTVAGPVDISRYTQVTVHLIWTTGGNGTFAIQGSNNHNPNDPTADDWVSLPASPVPTAANAASSALVNLSDLGFGWLRVLYTNTSGTGSFSCYLLAKGAS